MSPAFTEFTAFSAPRRIPRIIESPPPITWALPFRGSLPRIAPTVRGALEELTRLGFLRKAAVRTGRRGRPPVNYTLIGHPKEAEERFKTMMKQRSKFGTSQADEQAEAPFTYSTRLRPLGRSTPEIHLGQALDIACPNTGTTGWFDAHPRCPRKYGKPDYGSRRLKMILFADGSMWHGGKQYEKQKDTVNEKIRARIERQKERDKEVTKAWEALGWKVVRYWEEERARTIIEWASSK
jgi:hypothetical protein